MPSRWPSAWRWSDGDLLAANKRVVNQGIELMGRSQLQAFAALNDAVAHRSRPARAFGARAAEVGLRQAVRERDAPVRRVAAGIGRLGRALLSSPAMGYPLDVGGVDDYPVKVGSMLLTLVEPAKGFERAYNRWYERDHYYAGCMVGPWLFAGSRWVATRTLKDSAMAGGRPHRPADRRRQLRRHLLGGTRPPPEHFGEWSIRQVRDLYANGRGFAERTHVHTSTFHYVGSTYRDDDPVPVELALDHNYDGLFILWWDATTGTGQELHETLSTAAPTAGLLNAGSPIEMASSWVPSTPDQENRDAPMDLGSPVGGTDRLVQLLFVSGDRAASVDRVRAYTDGVEAEGLATLLLAAPFVRTVVGTDRYVDEL